MKNINGSSYFLKEGLSTKLSLLYNTILLGILENNIEMKSTNNQSFNIFEKLLNNYKEIEDIMNIEEQNLFKLLYFIRKKVHKILYDLDKIIDLKNDKNKMSLSSYFYLDLLVNDNINIINYTYSKEYIEQLNSLQENSNDKIYKKIIISKIIIELINNYKGSKNYEEEDENNKNELNQIETINKDLIKSNINNNVIELNLNISNILKKKIDEIYIEIINKLIESKKFDDYNYTYNIISQLDLENIYITQTIFEQLSKKLNTKDDFIKDYIISNIDDLFTNKKINFYYILFKYIFKNSIYIYHISFLNNLRKNIIKIIKSNSDKIFDLYSNIDYEIKDKFEYIIKTITDSKYYFEQYIINKKKPIYNKNELNTYNNCINDLDLSNNICSANKPNLEQKQFSKNLDLVINQSEITEANNNNSCKDNISYISYKILEKSSFLLHLNEKGNNPFLIYDEIKYGDNNITNFDKLKQIQEQLPDNNQKLQKSYKKFYEMLSVFEQSKEKDIKSNTNNIKIFLEFNLSNDNQEPNNNLYNLFCKYKLNIKEKEYSYQDENILKYKSLSEANGFQSLINEINKNKNKDKDNNETQNPITKSSQDNNSKPNSVIIDNPSNIQYNINSVDNKIAIGKSSKNDKDKYRIMKLLEIISEHKGQAEFIKELKNGCLISAGSRNELFFYILDQSNNKYTKKEEIKVKKKPHISYKKKKGRNPSNWILNIYETNNNSEENQKIELVGCSKLGIIFLHINNNYLFENESNFLEDYINSCSFYFQLKPDTYLIGGEKGICHFFIDSKKENVGIIKQIKGVYRGGIKINEDVFVFSSNSVLPNGEDKLIIYNIKENKCINILNYSFTISTNSLALMTHIETSSEVLLCGCKQYNKNQRNGILLVDLNTYKEEFLDTLDFEVYCFCPISNIDNKEENKIKLSPTNYIFVGGFEKDKNRGCIKLYKIEENQEETKNNITLEFIQDIIPDGRRVKKMYKIKEYNKNKTTKYKEVEYYYYFECFKRNISSIVQSKITGDILITSWDGNVYIFSPPNISYYLEYDNFDYTKENK